MKRSGFVYIIIFLIFFCILFAFSQQIREICIFLSYNALFFIDSLFSFSKGINPLVAWTLTLALVGLIVGLTKAVSIFQLHKKFYLYSFLGLVILLLLISKCSKPLNYNSSRDAREVMLWSNLSKKNSYSISTKYINEFPEGKHISEIKLLQETALWDSASAAKSSQVWKLYCDKFKGNTNYSQARINYDKVLWGELSKINTAESYRKYLSEFPNGLYSKSAQKKLNKYLHIDTPTVISEEKQNEVSIQSQQDTTNNELITSSNNTQIVTGEDNGSDSNEFVGNLNLSGGIKYEGHIKNDLPNGYGKEIFPDKTILDGFYINGKREGEFIYTKIDGSKEKQTFKNGIRADKPTSSVETKSPQTLNYIGPKKNGTGLPHGEGKEIFPDGTSLSGNYIDGKRDGEFIFTNKDGVKEKQVFKEGVRIK